MLSFGLAVAATFDGEVQGAEAVARQARMYSQLGLVVRAAIVNGTAGWASLQEGDSSPSAPRSRATAGSSPCTSSPAARTSTGSRSKSSNRQTKALCPVIARPTINVFISRVPSYE
jgi:hypothetical protein